jgi:hypothetical protein
MPIVQNGKCSVEDLLPWVGAPSQPILFGLLQVAHVLLAVRLHLVFLVLSPVVVLSNLCCFRCCSFAKQWLFLLGLDALRPRYFWRGRKGKPNISKKNWTLAQMNKWIYLVVNCDWRNLFSKKIILFLRCFSKIILHSYSGHKLLYGFDNEFLLSNVLFLVVFFCNWICDFCVILKYEISIVIYSDFKKYFMGWSKKYWKILFA